MPKAEGAPRTPRSPIHSGPARPRTPPRYAYHQRGGVGIISTPRSILAALTVLVGLIVNVTACSRESTARLPDHVTAAIVYNDEADRWHAGAIVAGDQTGSFLRVLCLTEADNPEGDHGDGHAGINIDAQPGEADGLWGFDWSWRIDGKEWDGGAWTLSRATQPASVVTTDPDIEAALLQELRNAGTAELIGTKDGEQQLSVRFDLATLFSTPTQFAIDECSAEAIEQRIGEYHAAYAYWIPDSNRHSITLIEVDPSTDHSLLVTCGPTGWTDDDAPVWIREAQGEVYAVATLGGFWDDTGHAHGRDDASIASWATVSWTGGADNVGTAVWDANYDRLQPPSASENLRFIDALRESEELIVKVRTPDAEPLEITLRGAALFAKPMGAELDACIREYAALNG